MVHPNEADECWSQSRRSLAFLGVMLGTFLGAQTPELLKVTPQAILAWGNWLDAGDDIGPHSTEVHCYKHLSLRGCRCLNGGGRARVDINDYDILPWHTVEMIAVDGRHICLVNTLRVDFREKKVSLSVISKGETKDASCKDMRPSMLTTVFLLG